MYREKCFCFSSLVGIILLGLVFGLRNEGYAQTKIRIGVFDTRAVAVAFYQSKFSTAQENFGSLHTRMKAAKEKDDKKEIASIEREATLRQAMMHEQGFGTGSITNVTKTIKDKISKLAKDEKLSIVVSKWDVLFNGENIEQIDVTEKIVDFFEPNEKIKSMTKEIMQSEPVQDAYLIND